MKIGAVIPARISSKRLKKKNIRLLGGKPLVFWTIDTLLEADVFQDITVTTDCQDVEQLIRDNYPEKAVKTLIRPADLREYDTSLDMVLGHYLEKNDVDFFGAFMPTFPFRKVEKLIEIDTYIRTRDPWRVSSITEKNYSTKSYFFPREEGVKNIFDPMRPLFCQLSQGSYAYWHRHIFIGDWKRFNLTQHERHLRVNLDKYEAIDIDNPEDFDLAEQVVAGKRIIPRPVEQHRHGEWVITTPRGVDIQALLNYVGVNKLENTEKPILVLKEVTHSFARMLLMLEILGRTLYSGGQAMKYLYDVDCSTFQSQALPTEFRLSRHYHFMRIRDEANTVSTYNAPDDSHGHLTGWLTDLNSTDWTICGGCSSIPDIIPWDRVIKMDDLQKQDFYVAPYKLEK